MESDGNWSKMVQEYCSTVAEFRLAWDAIALKFDTTINGTMKNVPTREEEVRIAQARAHLREIETSMRAFMKNHPENKLPELPADLSKKA